MPLPWIHYFSRSVITGRNRPSWFAPRHPRRKIKQSLKKSIKPISALSCSPLPLCPSLSLSPFPTNRSHLGRPSPVITSANFIFSLIVKRTVLILPLPSGATRFSTAETAGSNHWFAPILTTRPLHTWLTSYCENEWKLQNTFCVFWWLYKTLWRKWIEQTEIEREKQKGEVRDKPLCVCSLRCRDVCAWVYICWLFLVLLHMWTNTLASKPSTESCCVLFPGHIFRSWSAVRETYCTSSGLSFFWC